MASNSRRIVYNALERLLSTDFTNQIQLADANLDTGLVQAAVGTSAAGSGYGSASLVSGIVDGLVVSPANPGVDLMTTERAHPVHCASSLKGQNTL